MPALWTRRTTHVGDGPTTTRRSTDTVSRPHRSGVVDARRGELARWLAWRLGVASVGGRSSRPRRVARSRATPSTDHASGRFPSTVMSKTTSGVIDKRLEQCSHRRCGSMISSSTMSPPWSSPSPNSRAEHSMPLDVTPRICRRAISNPPVGRRRPARAARGRRRSKFIAPQTISNGPARRRPRRGGPGPRRRSRGSRRCAPRPRPRVPHRSCRCPRRPDPRSSRIARSSAVDSGRSTNSRSHDSEIFTRTASRTACRSR